MTICMRIMTTITISAHQDKPTKPSDPKIKIIESEKEAAIMIIDLQCLMNTKTTQNCTMLCRPHWGQLSTTTLESQDVVTTYQTLISISKTADNKLLQLPSIISARPNFPYHKILVMAASETSEALKDCSRRIFWSEKLSKGGNQF